MRHVLFGGKNVERGDKVRGVGRDEGAYLEFFDLFRPSTPKTRPTVCHNYRRFSFWIELNVI